MRVTTARQRSSARNSGRSQENTGAPGKARDFALDALLKSEWEGRDEWYMSLFADGTLRDLLDGHDLLNPLGPVRWRWSRNDGFLEVTRYLPDPNRNVHDMAVTCLVLFHLQSARRDALIPLLPWLEDPKWSSARDRLRLIQSMDRLNARESIPGLIAVLGQEASFERAYAAEALAHFKDPRAVPALRDALSRETENHLRFLILLGLEASGGITADEGAAALEALAVESATPRGRTRIEEYRSSPSATTPVQIGLGLFLRDRPVPSSGIVASSLDRVRKLEQVQPQAARILQETLDQWSHPLIDRAFLDHLRRGSVTASSISAALRKRMNLSRAFPLELGQIAEDKGVPAGVASALLSDVVSGERILRSSDVEAQIALLACSRLTRHSLPLESVARILTSSNSRLREASERYLEVEDSPRARQLVLSMHPGEAPSWANDSDMTPATRRLNLWTFWRSRCRTRSSKRTGLTKLSPY